MRRAVQDLENVSVSKMQKATARLADGKITIREWQKLMQEQIKSAQLVSTSLAVGGRQRLSGADLAKIEKDIAKQYERLQNWAKQIKAGTASPSEGRAAMYGKSTTKLAYENKRSSVVARAGEQLVLWVRTARESCEGCITQASYDPRPLGQVPPLGSQDCAANCRCFYEYVDAA